MKKITTALLLVMMCLLQLNAAENKVIRIATDQTDLVFKVVDNGRLYQSYCVKVLNSEII